MIETTVDSKKYTEMRNPPLYGSDGFLSVCKGVSEMLPVRKEIVDLVRHISIDKLYLLRDYAALLAKEEEPLTPEDIAAIEKGEAQIARGEWVCFDDVKRQFGL